VNAEFEKSCGAIAIVSTGAATPGFANLPALFDAWCANEAGDGSRGEELTVDALCRVTLDSMNVVRGFRTSTGMLLATTKGEMAEQVAWMRRADAGECGNPPSLEQPLEKLLSTYGIAGPSYVISTACTSGLVALIDSALLLLDGEAEEMVALAADVAGDFVQDGFRALHAISPTRCRPFDRERDGLALGSAAAACLLTREVPATTGCILSGWGISNDATHMTAPDRTAGGLIRAIRQALQRANISAAEVDVVFAHGTGTRYNDAMECVAIESVFLQAGCSPAVTSAKGFLGHTLGAAGLIEAVLGVEILRRQIIPPITGLQSPEHSGIDFVRTPRACRIRHVLKMASGFGGMNAAVILSRGGGAHAE
jgi:hypothetical protein